MEINLDQRRIENQDVFVTFLGGINNINTQHLMSTFLQMSGQGPKTISFLLSSPGGDVAAGITLYNFLRTLPDKLIIYNMGSIDSIATVIFLAGRERYACPHSTFLFHGVNLSLTENSRLTLNQIKEMESKISKDEERIAGIIADNTTITKDEIKSFFSQGASKDPAFAKKRGIIDGIHEPKINNSFCITVHDVVANPR